MSAARCPVGNGIGKVSRALLVRTVKVLTRNYKEMGGGERGKGILYFRIRVLFSDTRGQLSTGQIVSIVQNETVMVGFRPPILITVPQ